MKTRLIIAIILHILAVIILWHSGGRMLALGIYIALTANNIEQSGRLVQKGDKDSENK